MNVQYVNLGDVCSKGSSNIAQKDLDAHTGKYPIYGASGYIKSVDFYQQEDEYIAPSTLNEALQYSMSNDSHYATIQQDFNQIKDILTDNTYRYNPNDDFTPIIDVLEQEYKNIKDNTEKQKFTKKVADKLNEYYAVHEEEGNIDLANFMNDLKQDGFIKDLSTSKDPKDKK